MNCPEYLNLQKYRERPSPPRPANEEGCRGNTYLGNDGNQWQSRQISTGAYRWFKVASAKVASAKVVSAKVASAKVVSAKVASKSNAKVKGKRKSPVHGGKFSSYFIRITSSRKIPVAELIKTSKIYDITLKATHFKKQVEYNKYKDNYEIECFNTISHNPSDIKTWAKSLKGVKSVGVKHEYYL